MITAIHIFLKLMYQNLFKLLILQRCHKIFSISKVKKGIGWGFLEIDIDTNRCTDTHRHANNRTKMMLDVSHEPDEKQ